MQPVYRRLGAAVRRTTQRDYKRHSLRGNSTTPTDRQVWKLISGVSFAAAQRLTDSRCEILTASRKYCVSVVEAGRQKSAGKSGTGTNGWKEDDWRQDPSHRREVATRKRGIDKKLAGYIRVMSVRTAYTSLPDEVRGRLVEIRR